MEELSKHGNLELASMRAGMDRKTAAKYRDAGKLPSEMTAPRTWRTRSDPFEEDWPAIERRLSDAPELEAKTIFELLVGEQPGRYQEGQLRTLQRRVKQWFAESGPEKLVFFAQEHKPGEAAQTDFTHVGELDLTIAGEHSGHLLCHLVLPYSNWEWATVCMSESIPAIKRGVQAAIFRLGRIPRYHQTDNSSAATHDLKTGQRGFNEDYQRLMDHLGMTPRTIAIGESNQNGDVEALNGALKRRLKQHLLVRGDRDFASVAEFEGWVQSVLEKANALRTVRTTEDLAAMRPLTVARLPEHQEVDVPVTSWSTITVKHNIYSVPSRLMGETVRIHIYDDRLDVFYGNLRQLQIERLLGKGGHHVNYRHVIWSLVQKPGAFDRYKYKEDLFPTLTFRRAYDALQEAQPGRKADLIYLRVLHLAASTMEADVEAALQLLLEARSPFGIEQVKALVGSPQAEVPVVPEPKVDLLAYDALLGETVEVAS